MKKEERQAHREKIDKYKEEMSDYRGKYEKYNRQKRDINRIIREMYSKEGQVSKEILVIMEDIIQTQNKGMPLSEYQLKMLSSLEDLFKGVSYDELTRPRIVTRDDGTFIKDIHIKDSSGVESLYTAEAPNAYKNETLETVLPLGENTHYLIDLISETIADNAKIMKELGKQSIQTKGSPKQIKTSDITARKIEEAMIIAENSGTETGVDASVELAKVLGDYIYSKDRTMSVVSENGKKWMEGVPIVGHGDTDNTTKTKKSQRVDSSVAKNETYDINLTLPADAKLVQMLPKGITEQLIEILARVMKENSQLYNELRENKKPKHPERKFSWKIVSFIAVAALMGAGAIHFTTNTDFDKKEENIEEPNPIVYDLDVSIFNSDYRLLKTIYEAIGDDEIADIIYREEVKDVWGFHKDQYKVVLGKDYEDLSYAEMLEKFNEKIEILNSEETVEFIERLKEKVEARQKLTIEEENKLLELNNLQECVSDMFYLRYNIFNNEKFDNLVIEKNIDKSDIVKEEKIEDWLKYGLVGVGSIGLGVLGTIIVENAKKKEAKKKKELGQGQESEVDHELGD